MSKLNKSKNLTKLVLIAVSALSLIFASGCELIDGFLGLFNKNDGKVTISETSAEVAVGASITLTAESSEGLSITWYSDDESIATVDGGVVTGVAQGETEITASDGKKFAICQLTVTPAGSPDDDDDDDGKDVPKWNNLSLVWSDEFDGNSLDTSKWNYQTGTQDNYYGNLGPTDWGNNELQSYSQSNVTVSDGNLKITAKKENKDGKRYTSGRIVTRDKASWTYGYFEARMKLPTVNGMWPAFWMLPQPTDHSSSNNVYGGWAANGELDIMEAMGRLPNSVCGTIHFGGYWPENTYKTKEYTFTNSTFGEWHTYGVEWTANYIKWYVDGVCYSNIQNNAYWSVASSNPSAPFDQPFYMLFNLAVDSGKFDPGAQVPANFSQESMFVDYVRVYQ